MHDLLLFKTRVSTAVKTIPLSLHAAIRFIIGLAFVVCLPNDCIGAEKIRVKGVEISYSMEGNGPPVVLIHGLHSSTELNWRKPGIIKKLSEHYQIISIDLPGHGQSEKTESTDAYGLQMVEDVAAILDHLKIAKAHFAGYSLGGLVVLKFAAIHPERTLSATLCGMGWMKQGGLLQRYWSNIAGREGARTPEACVKGISELAISEEDLKSIELPVSVIVGSDDPVKRLYVKPMQSARHDWIVVEIPGGAHLSTIRMKEFHEALLKSLDEKSKP